MIYYKLDMNESDWQYVREEVFVKEQGFHHEFDEIDKHALHLTVYMDGVLAGCARCFADQKKDTYVFGRIAVLKVYRKSGIGTFILQKLVAIAADKGMKYVRLDAQCRAVSFYEKYGFYQSGEHYMEEHVEHIGMRKDL